MHTQARSSKTPTCLLAGVIISRKVRTEMKTSMGSALIFVLNQVMFDCFIRTVVDGCNGKNDDVLD